MSDAGLRNPLNNIEQMQNGQMAQYGTDKGLMVRFYNEPVLQEAQSTAAGQPVYENVDFIEITMPGGKSVHKRRVQMEDDHMRQVPGDPNRFPAQWRAYKAAEEEVHDGLALEHWPPMDKARCKMLKMGGVHTVEQLAAIPDSALGAIPMMDARKLRDLALRYLEGAQGGAPLAKANAEIAELKAQMVEMQRMLELALANQKAKPGRKPAIPTEGDDDNGTGT